MKKYKTKFWSRNVPKAILTGRYALKSELVSDVRLEDSILEVCLDTEVGTPDQCWLFLYDRKDSLFKSAFLEALEYNDRTFRFALDDGFLDSMRGTDAIQQGRLCLALQWKRQFSCFFLKYPDRAGARLALQGDFSVFFSKGGLLSAKFVDVKQYLKTARIREKDGQLLQQTFDAFLVSNLAVCEGIYSAQLKSEGEGRLSVSLSALGETAIQSCYLLLRESGNEMRKLILPGTFDHEWAHFDLSQMDADVLWSDSDLMCYVAFDLGTAYVYSRLRQGEDINWQQTAKADGLFPTSCLWQDSGRYFGIAARVQRDNGAFQLLFVPTAKRNTLVLQWHAAQQAQLLMAGKVWHHGGTGKEKKYPFAFSVIMSVYNVESYIDEAIDCLLQQDIGFLENIQLILVDDGSKDQSGAICDCYAEQYPNNVIVLHKENGGLSSARNAGKKLATGKYISFFDPDDKLSLNTFSTVKHYFDRWYDRTDIVTIPLFYFEARQVSHEKNYKFNKGSRVIDLWQDPTGGCMTAAASFYKREFVQKFDFDTSLPAAEDFYYNMRLFSEKMSLGVVAECQYWYRKRAESGSLINGYASSKACYKEYFEKCTFSVFDLYQEKYGFIPQFAQYMVMMDLQWRFRTKKIPEGVLSSSEHQDYLERMRKTLQSIDDEMILKQKMMSYGHFAQAFEMKYGISPAVRYRFNDAQVYCKDVLIAQASSFAEHFDFIRVKGETLTLEGYMVLVGFPDDIAVDIYAAVGDNYYPCRRVDRELDNSNCFGKTRSTYAFYGEVPLVSENLNRKLRMAMVVNGHLIIGKRYGYGRFCPITNTHANQYYYVNNGLVLFGRRDGIELQAPTMERAEYEALYTQELLEKCEAAAAPRAFPLPVFPSTLTREKYEEIVRLRQFALTAEKKRPIWLISDSLTIADDNGAALFKYLMQQEDLPADVYFVIREDCPDYEKMAAIGPVLAFGSEEHLKIHLIADLAIGSQSADFVITPFCKDTAYYGDRIYYYDLLSNQKYVFLQHGIIKVDLTKYLQKYHRNISGLVTSANREYQSILDYPYYYDANTVWLTGLPRFDYLYEDSRKQITVMPTWRTFLNGTKGKDLERSEFYCFYKELLTDYELKRVLKEKGYTVALKLHPELLQYEALFKDLGAEILDAEIPYRKVYAESNVMVTDYSSTAMEFAYMRKPVVYCQFDKKKFFERHYAHGYFSYEDDGFGPVTTTVEETVQEIIKLVENDCRMEQKYLDRCNAFFPVNDYHNCEQVYQKLKEL